MVLQQPSPHELVIGGITCAACAARVQAKLNRLDGVTASVNLSTERAWVSAPPDLSARALVDVVEAAGYTAEVAAPPGPIGGHEVTVGRPRYSRGTRHRGRVVPSPGCATWDDPVLGLRRLEQPAPAPFRPSPV